MCRHVRRGGLVAMSSAYLLAGRPQVGHIMGLGRVGRPGGAHAGGAGHGPWLMERCIIFVRRRGVLGMNKEVSHGWRYAIVSVALAALGVLAWIAIHSYSPGVGTPIPATVVDRDGRTVFTGADIIAGQQVFQKHGLMENGTIWGHGAYLGPDFSAAYLHQLALDTKDPTTLTKNRYDGKTGTLRFTAPEVASYHRQIGQWKKYFAGSPASHGLAPT